MEEEVLYQDSAYKTHYSRKLELKWKGHYVIVAILLNGAYKITDQGEVLHIPVNGDQYNWQFLEPIVIIREKS